MAQIREIRKRIVAVGTIQRITKTMQMIATAKFTTAVQRAKAAKPYSEKVKQLVGEVVAAAGDIQHPLINGPSESPKRELLLIVSSDRGFCGAFNGHILRKSLEQVRKLKSSSTALDLETSGKKAVGFFEFQRVPISEKHSFGDKPDYEEIDRLAQRYVDEFTQGKYDAIRVVYMQFISNAKQMPQLMQLLPLQAAASSEAQTAAVKALYDYSPSSTEILDDLLPLTVKTALYQAFLDASVSEQIMRMIAMKSATENASDVRKDLKRKYNRARQAKITTELMEVISGAAALE
ncbi:MAG: ATP synthase F1 subunit gamma [Planctomycetes bacterium]|nr:ATP synthase F1 subunit gamma [Planctomycetota bacterium]